MRARAMRVVASLVLLGALGSGIESASARAACATDALGGATVSRGADSAPDRLRPLVHHLGSTLAEKVRVPVEVRGRPAGRVSSLRRTDSRATCDLPTAGPPAELPARASGIRLRGPPTISTHAP